jgi:hypothetical protein
MIEVFEGRLGGGKTYSAVSRMMSYLASGGAIYTNIELNLEAVRDYLRAVHRWELQPGQYTLLQDDQVGLFHRYTSPGTPDCPSLVVIDEAHIWFNARDWSQCSRELLTFLTQSRKQSTDIIFISQSCHNMDKQFMRLIQYIWTFRDMTRSRIKAGPVSFGWPFDQILCNQWDYDGKTLLSRKWEKKDKRIFACYNTFVLLRKFPRLEGQQTDFRGQGKIKPKWRGVVARIAAGAVLVVGLATAGGCRWVAVTDLRKKVDAQEKELEKLRGVVASNAVRVVPARAVPGPVIAPPVPPPPPPGTNGPLWRVTAVCSLGVGVSSADGRDSGFYREGEACPLGTVVAFDVSSGRYRIAGASGLCEGRLK